MPCRALILIPTIAALVIGMAGCRGRIIRATRMPAHYQAATVTNAKTADLGRLSMPTTSSSIIEPEDVIDVSIASGIEPAGQVVPVPVRVADDGMANLALVGPIQLAGIEPFVAEQRIGEAAIERGLYRAPQVTVTIRKKAVNRVTVIGAVGKQGVQELPRGQSTLLSALVAAGSLSDRAGTTIEVRRNRAGSAQQAAAKKGKVQLISATNSADPPRVIEETPTAGEAENLQIDLATIDPSGNNDVQLQDGDIVRVETRDPVPISVIGLVRKPGQYEMPVNQPLHVLDALALAGERSNAWADKIIITRHVRSEREPVVIQTSVAAAQHDDASNIRLAPGDIVSVEQTPGTASCRASFASASWPAAGWRFSDPRWNAEATHPRTCCNPFTHSRTPPRRPSRRRYASCGSSGTEGLSSWVRSS